MKMKLEGVRELQLAINRKIAQVGEASMEGLEAVGSTIIAEAKDNLRRNRTNNNMQLSGSGRVQKKQDGTLDAGFFSQDTTQGYAAYVEFGRGPSTRKGAIPLAQTLKAWVHRKLGVPYGKELETATFLIARKIHRKGTRPQPFFTPAIKKVEDKAEEIMSKYIDKATK